MSDCIVESDIPDPTDSDRGDYGIDDVDDTDDKRKRGRECLSNRERDGERHRCGCIKGIPQSSRVSKRFNLELGNALRVCMALT